VNLVPRSELVRTGQVDHADWNYRPMLGYIQRMRFRLALDLLTRARPERLLEIGYGSGIFLRALAERADRVLGVDPHPFAAEVAAVLSRHGVDAELMRAKAEAIPLPAATVDCVIAVSALEFVDDLDAVCREMKRILKPDGYFVVVTPAHSPLADAGLRMLTGAIAKRDFGEHRVHLIPALLRHFRGVLQQEWLGPPLPHLYTGLRLVPSMN
jgi:ubiquinone/menaquinone biosynthesis C-methylase UbiE